ncbi:GDSL-type esterase/lipase family protein [Myxococcota bacterium]|nr:GDSL-type esterase/lipase family protein [Myxococcota bacterium]
MTRALRNLMFSAIFAATLLGGAELILRVVGWPDPGIYAGDPGSLWWLRPSLAPRALPFPERGTTFTVRTNRLGYRGPDPVEGAWICLGDSTTFGWGVEEDEAWPARLSLALGRPVSNGGVPGYTSHQGLLTLQNSLSTRPERVLIAYLVRDADPAPTPDHSRAPRAVPDLRLMTALRQLRPRPQGQAAAPAGPTARVPADRYLNNLRALKAQAEAAGAEVSFVVFPMLRRPEAHLAALQTLSAEAQVLSPALPPESFFAEDPIHLTAEGHDQLARQLAEALR